MRMLMWACLCLVVISSGVTAGLWHELEAEREQTAELRTRLIDAEHRSLGSVVSVHAVDTDPPTGTPTGTPAAFAPELPPSVPAQSTDAVAAREGGDRIDLGSRLLKDPGYRKALLAQARMTIKRTHLALVEELGLSEIEADQLFDLLAERQVDASSSILRSQDGVSDQLAAAESVQSQAASQRKRDAELLALLGSSRYVQWQEYQRTVPGRIRITQMSSALALAGQPMSESQVRSLTNVVLSEQQRQGESMQVLSRGVRQLDAQSRVQLQSDILDVQEGTNGRILAAAAPLLNTRQLESLRESLDQQIVVNRASLRLQQQQAEMHGLSGYGDRPR